MPTFLGLAVSLHSPEGPLPEYGLQKQTKFHRITSYIPVPPAKVPPGGSKPEQSTFAISITLLTPGLHVPYSTPKPTDDEPNPRPRIVGGHAGAPRHGPVIAPYKPLTTSPNETIAAYIYFDGRAKEEVATLLRRGEETWVNSRWVSVPDSEGGGLAEREFLFREVGLERWLNGLDLEGKDKDVAAKIERRKLRLEKKRQKRREARVGSSDEDDAHDSRNGVLRYSARNDAPVETLPGNEDFFTTDSDSDDEPPVPEAAGQIKVALFRVLASGEIKRGEYSPQFDAHDDDEQNGGGDGEDIDHTTSFAKPKTLDPKSISTQTVTGIDPPDKPYAVFTFLYRGERQLRKMGIIETPKTPQVTSPANKRKSGTIDFGSLKPLNAATGTKNFGGYRDKSPKNKQTTGQDIDSDAEEEDDDGNNDTANNDVDDEKDSSGRGFLSPEDVYRQGELADGVRKIKLKRQHSAEPMGRPSASPGAESSVSPQSGTPVPGSSSQGEASASTTEKPSAQVKDEGPIVSPYKKHRASLPGFDDTVRKSLGQTFLSAQKERGNSEGSISTTIEARMEEDEEL